MSDGYAYTTISARPGERVRIGVSLYLDRQAWIAVCGEADARPRLSIALGDVSVGIGPGPDEVTAEDARIARSLADKAAQYAAMVEQLAAASEPDPASNPAA
jgi:hypothetical protein